MNEMLEWVKYSWSKGFQLDGRARRREFWWNFLFYEVIALIATAILGLFGAFASLFLSSDGMVFINIVIQALSTIVSIAISLVIMLPLYVRRLHDIGMSGWIYLACIVGTFCCCIGYVALIVLMCMDSKEDNQYGPNPKAFGGTMPGNGGYGTY